MAEPLYLVHRARAIPLARGAVAVGRLEECQVLLDGHEVSRRHARIVATPEGPLLVDRSRHGTLLNDAMVVAPALLRDGDTIKIGRHHLFVTAAPRKLGAVPAAGPEKTGLGSRLADWRRRYGHSEGVAVLVALAAGLAVRKVGGGIVLAAFAATFAEALWFYTSLAVRDLRRDRREAESAVPPLPTPGAGVVLRRLVLEFGAAEVVDSLLLRPACYWLGMRALGDAPGLLAGKVAADALFYGLILRAFHWRLATRRQSPRGKREIPSTAASLPRMPEDGDKP